MFQQLPQEYEQSVSIDTLEYYPGNPRRGDIPAIRDSITNIGWFGCLYCQKSTRYILAGNQSCLSALDEGATELPVLWIHCDDKTAKKIVLAANRLADRGSYDLDDLAAMLSDINENDILSGTGYDSDDLDELLSSLDAQEREQTRNKGKVSVLFSSESEEWYTPQAFIESARDVMGSIHLDPASCEFANKIVQAERYFTKEDNGLVQQWSGTVWMNPPYGKGIDPLDGKEKSNQLIWTTKLIDSFQAGHVTQAVCLVTSVPETNFFQNLLKAAGIVCFVDKRINFYNEGPQVRGNLKGSGIFYFGDNKRFFFNAFREFGEIFIRCPYYDSEFDTNKG